MAKKKTPVKEESILDKGLDFTGKLGQGILDTFVPGGDQASKNLRLIKMALVLNKNRPKGVSPAAQYLEALNVGMPGNDLDNQLKQLRVQKMRNELGPHGIIEQPFRKYPDELVDKDRLAEYAFGPYDATMDFVGGLGRLGDFDWFSNQNKAVTNLKAFNREILRTAASEVSGRPSVYYLQLSKEEIPEPAGLTSDLQEMRKYEALLGRFEGQLTKNIGLLDVAKSQGDKARISKVSKAIADQDYIIRRLRNIVNALQDETKQGTGYRSDFDMTTDSVDSATIDDFLKDDF